MADTNTLSFLRTTYEAGAAGTSTYMPKLTQAWYNKTFLSNATPYLVHDNYGMPTSMKKNQGDQVVWRRWKKLDQNITPLTDGVTPSGKQLEYEQVVATVKQYGDYTIITDWVEITHVDKVVNQAQAKLGQQAGESLDSVTRDIINAGSNLYRSTADGGSPAYGTGARTTVNGCITKKILDAAIVKLQAADAKYPLPMIGASTKVATEPVDRAFVCIIHPHVAHSLKQETESGLGSEFVKREKYGSTSPLFPNEVGKYDNVRFVTTTNAKVWASVGGTTDAGDDPASDTYRSTDGTNADVYSALLIAEEAYGVVKLGGAFTTYLDRAGGNNDPLHQRNTAAWKAAKTAAILNDNWMIRLEVAALW